MPTRIASRVRQSLSDPVSRPSALNLGVAIAYAIAAALGFLIATLSSAETGGTGSPLWVVYAVAFALLYLLNSYGYHWHATYTFEGSPRTFGLGTIGAVLGTSGLAVLLFFPVIGLVFAAIGVVCNVLGVSWGTFVYTYRKYSHN